ncbi:DUF6491 family protein [Dokdonella soli]|uniref:Uncharacterized protein n=1 Tax=Dokdonella soli TaxID=529810 RepID=A0ABP3U6H7_9GAMM
MKYRVMGFFALAVLAMGTAQADTRATQQKSLDKYTPYLKAPVDGFTFWSLYKWRLVGPQKVVVWSTIKDAYLLTVEANCPKLEWAHGIGLTSQQSHQVSKRLDYVTIARDRCRIEEIRPIDTARMEEEQRAKRK